MTHEQAAQIVASEIERRFSDIGQLIENTIDYHLDILDKKISGNQYHAGEVYSIERYLRMEEGREHHLRDVRRAITDYLTDRIDAYPSDLRANSPWYLAIGATGSAAMMGLSEIGPEATMAGIAVFGIGAFILVFYLTRRWGRSLDYLYATRSLISAGDLDRPLVAALEHNRQRYLEKFEARDG